MTLTFGRPAISQASASTKARITIGEAGLNFAAPFKPRVWYSGSLGERPNLKHGRLMCRQRAGLSVSSRCSLADATRMGPEQRRDRAGARLQRGAIRALRSALRRRRAGSWMVPGFHAAIDEAISDAHGDPQNFDLTTFAVLFSIL